MRALPLIFLITVLLIETVLIVHGLNSVTTEMHVDKWGS